MTNKPTTVDEYIASLPKPAAAKIATVRTIVNETAPQLTEAIKWSSPAFIHPDGVIMLVTSAHKTHINVVFTPSTREHFAQDLTDIPSGKGSLKFGFDDELPNDLLRSMIVYRIAEYEQDGIKWM